MPLTLVPRTEICDLDGKEGIAVSLDGVRLERIVHEFRNEYALVIEQTDLAVMLRQKDEVLHDALIDFQRQLNLATARMRLALQRQWTLLEKAPPEMPSLFRQPLQYILSLYTIARHMRSYIRMSSRHFINETEQTVADFCSIADAGAEELRSFVDEPDATVDAETRIVLERMQVMLGALSAAAKERVTFVHNVRDMMHGRKSI